MYISISSYTYTYRYIHIHINIYIHTSSTATTTMTHPHIHRGGGGTRNQRKSAASETSRAPPQPHNHRGGGGGTMTHPQGGGGGVGDAAPYIHTCYMCLYILYSVLMYTVNMWMLFLDKVWLHIVLMCPKQTDVHTNLCSINEVCQLNLVCNPIYCASTWRMPNDSRVGHESIRNCSNLERAFCN